MVIYVLTALLIVTILLYIVYRLHLKNSEKKRSLKDEKHYTFKI